MKLRTIAVKMVVRLAAVGLLAGASLGAAPYQVQYTTTAPTGPADPIWNTANIMTPLFNIDGFVTPAATDCAMDVRYLWDGNYLYGRIMVTDNMHVMSATADMQNSWNQDIVEFYVNPAATPTGTTFVADLGSTQDAWGINNQGTLILSNSQIGTTKAQGTAWTDATFDLTATNTVNGGNFGIQEKWAWTGSATAGGCGLATSPTASTLLRIGGAVADNDTLYSITRKAHISTANFAGTAGVVWNNPSTYGAAVLVAPTSPNPIITGITLVDQTHVNVTFQLSSISGATAMDSGSAQNAFNYAFNQGITVSSAVLLNNVTVQLTTAPLTQGTNYSVTVTGVLDNASNFINPNPATLSLVIPAAQAPTITSASTTNLTQVTVVFSQPVDPNTAFNQNNYAVTGLTVIGVSQVNASTYTLSLSGMTSGMTYTLTVNGVQDLWSPPDVMVNATKAFTTPIGPTITSATATNLAQVTVVFSRAVDPATAGTMGNYAINGLVVGGVAVVNATTVQLSVSTMAPNRSYTLTVNNVQDTQTPPLPIAVNSTKGFTTPAGPTVTSASATNLVNIRVTFTKSVDMSTAMVASNYALSGGATVSSIAQATASSVILTVSTTLAQNTSYTLTALNIADLLVPPAVTPSSTAAFTTVSGPTINNAVAGNLTTITVTFSKNVDMTTAMVASNYAIAGVSISSVASATASSVTLTVSTMLPGTSYTLTVNNVQDTVAPPIMIGLNATRGFTTAAAPTVTSASAGIATQVTVAFSKAMSAATLTNAANYSISGGISVTAATASASSVTLTVSSMTVGASYTVSVRNVQDSTAIPIDPTHATATFVLKSLLLNYAFTAAGTPAFLAPTASATNLDGAVSSTITGASSTSIATLLSDTFGVTPTGSSPELNFKLAVAASTDTNLAITNNQYWQFQIKPANGYALNLSSLDFDHAGRANDNRWVVETSIDGFGTLAANVVAVGRNTGVDTWAHYSIDLSAARFQGLTSTLTIRVYACQQMGANNSQNWFDNVTLWGSVSQLGTPPTVAITSPTSPASATMGDHVVLTATASAMNSGGSIQTVQFLDGAAILGSGVLADGISTWTYSWNTAGASGGAHNITAKATDNISLTATSTVVVVNVNVILPTVTITSPANPSSAQIGQTINFTATASTTNTNATISTVQFYDNSTFIGAGVATGGVYTFAWPTTSATGTGAHNITAKATDSFGAVASSAPATVVNLTAVPPPVVAITSPTSTYTVQVGNVINFTATATSTNPIASVVFLDGATPIGTAGLAPGGIYTFAWTTTGTTPSGVRTITARATDNVGTPGTSAAVFVNLLPLGPPSVAITSPVGTTSTGTGATVRFTITASTTNPGGSIASVVLLDNGAVQSSTATLVSAGVYTYAWTTPSTTGLHTITARATDDGGRTQVSASVTINVSGALPPVVAITVPTGTMIKGKTNTARFTATASSPNQGGSIVTVQFCEGQSILGLATVVGGAYTFGWDTSSAAFGMHYIYARATDDGGRATDSASAMVMIRLLGDSNGDGVVDGVDFANWGTGYQKLPATYASGDFNGDGKVDGVDFAVWGANYQHKATYTIGAELPKLADSSTPPAPVLTPTPTPVGAAPRLTSATLSAGALVLTFDSAVVAGSGAVEVYGAATGLETYAAVYADGQLTLTFTAPLAADTYTVRVISDFVVGAGGALSTDLADTTIQSTGDVTMDLLVQ